MGAMEWGSRSGSGVRSKKYLKPKVFDPNSKIKNKSSYDIVRNNEKFIPKPEPRTGIRKSGEESVEALVPSTRDMQNFGYRVEHIKSSPILPKNNIFP